MVEFHLQGYKKEKAYIATQGKYVFVFTIIFVIES